MSKFQKDTKQLGIFITAGFPERGSLPEQLVLLQENGVDFIEIGMPFSDPMADGPVIQYSSEVALKNGMTLDVVFEQVMSVKEQIRVPLVLMGYFNPVFRYGLEKFLANCEQAGISGLIIPDLSDEVFQANYQELMARYAVPLIHLVTPQTSNERIQRIAELSEQGFVYLVSSNATTGNAFSLASSAARLQEIRKLCGEVPVFIGFGIKTAENLREVHQLADGGIIGSEYIRQVEAGNERSYLKQLNY